MYFKEIRANNAGERQEVQHWVPNCLGKLAEWHVSLLEPGHASSFLDPLIKFANWFFSHLSTNYTRFHQLTRVIQDDQFENGDFDLDDIGVHYFQDGTPLFDITTYQHVAGIGREGDRDSLMIRKRDSVNDPFGRSMESITQPLRFESDAFRRGRIEYVVVRTLRNEYPVDQNFQIEEIGARPARAWNFTTAVHPGEPYIARPPVPAAAQAVAINV